jgi:hypothetical protein
MDEKLRRLQKSLCKELAEYSERGISAGNINAIYQMAVAAEKLMKMEVLEMELDDGESRGGGMWRAEGGYSGRRRYSRDGGSYGDDYGEEGSYTNRGGNRGRGREYSRDNGKRNMIEKMEDMMEEAKSPEEREELKKCIARLRDM